MTFFARSIPNVTIAMISYLGQFDEKSAPPNVALSCR